MYSIIVPTHNREDILCEMLESFKRLRGISDLRFELIIVANACVDNTVSRVQESLSNEAFNFKICEELTPGLSVARNRGLKEASGEIIVFLDDDILFDECWLTGLEKSFLQSDYDIIGGKIDLWWKQCTEPSWFTLYERRLLGFNNHGSSICDAEPSMIFGGNFAFKRSILNTVGGFDSSLGRVGNSKGAGEENDFVMRAVSNGYKIGYSSFFTIKHLVTSERITFHSLKSFAIGAGKSRRKIKKRSKFESIAFLIKQPLRLWKVLKNSNSHHAKLILWDRLAESGIIR